MSSNRLSYDNCAYQKSLEQSTAPLDYMMYEGKYNNTAKCRIEFGVVGGNDVSLYSGNLVDLESDLRGQTRYASSCPSKMYNPNCASLMNGLPSDDPKCKSLKLKNLKNCNYPNTHLNNN